MQFRKFIFSVASTALLVAPFAINANAPATDDEIVVAPFHGQNAVVEGLSLSSVIVKQDKTTATIHVTAKNNTKKEIGTTVAAALMQVSETSPMSRMAPMPMEVAQTGIALRLAPGESVSKTVVVQLPKHVTQQLEARASIEKSSANSAPDDSGNIAFPTAWPLPSVPSFFTRVRSVAPSVKSKKLARR